MSRHSTTSAETDADEPPITAADVPPIPTTHLELAREDAERRMADAAARVRASIAGRARAEQAHDTAGASMLEATRSSERIRNHLAEAVDPFDAATVRVERAGSLLDEARHDAAGKVAIAEHLDGVRDLLRALVVTGPPTTLDELPPLLERLSGIIDLVAGAPGLLDAAPLQIWHDQLQEGTAPVRADAAELLDALERAEADWLGCGAGDLGEDPIVAAAVVALAECDAAVSAAAEGALTGEHARVEIELANQRRIQLEAKGKRADPDELAAALEAESESLARVGFDSMLDFRITMSGAGVGALTAQRRRVVAAERSAALIELERCRAERARHHADLRGRRDALRRSAVELFGLDGSLPLPRQLRQVLELPPSVAELAAEVDQRAAAAVTDSDAATHAERAAAEEMDAARADLTLRRTSIDGMEQELAAAVEHARTAADRLAAAQDDVGSAAVEAAAAADAAATAAAERTALMATAYLPEDVDVLAATVVQLVAARAVTSGDRPVTLEDPLPDQPLEITLQLLDALEVAGSDVTLITSRRALLRSTRHRHGSVRVLDGRRHRRLLRQRRNLVPSTNTR